MLLFLISITTTSLHTKKGYLSLSPQQDSFIFQKAPDTRFTLITNTTKVAVVYEISIEKDNHKYICIQQKNVIPCETIFFWDKELKNDGFILKHEQGCIAENLMIEDCNLALVFNDEYKEEVEDYNKKDKMDKPYMNYVRDMYHEFNDEVESENGGVDNKSYLTEEELNELVRRNHGRELNDVRNARIPRD